MLHLIKKYITIPLETYLNSEKQQSIKILKLKEILYIFLMKMWLWTSESLE